MGLCRRHHLQRRSKLDHRLPLGSLTIQLLLLPSSLLLLLLLLLLCG